MIDSGKHPLSKLTDEQKEVFIAYVNAFLERKSKEKFTAELNSDAMRGLVATVTAISYVSERRLQEAKDDQEFKSILELFRTSQKEGQVLPELQRVYTARKEEALRRFEICLKDLKARILGKEYPNYLNLMQCKEEDKHILAEKIWTDALNTCPDSRLMEKYHRLIHGVTIIRCDADFELSSPLLKMKGESLDLIEYFAYLVYKPEERLLSETFLDPEWEKFPLKWAKHLPIAHVKTLFDIYKNGEDISPYYVSRYEKDGISAIRKLASDPIARTPIAKELVGIKEAINQALICYENRQLMAFMYTIFPVLEGILWNYSAYLDAIDEAEIYVKGAKPNETIATDGSIISDPTIGILMRHTAFKDFLNLEFIEYFCNELYSERNPILHGRLFGFATIENAARKLSTLEYLLISMRRIVETKIISELDKVTPPEVIEELLSRHKRDKGASR